MKNTKEELEKIINNLTSEMEGLEKKYGLLWNLRSEYRIELSGLERKQKMLQKDSSQLVAELNRVIQKREVVNNPKIRDWKKYKALTIRLIDTRNAIEDSEEGK